MKRIKYVSRFAQPFSEPELEQLADQAAAKNQDLEVTGVLITSGGVFFQVLEGPEAAVDGIYGAIEADTRHTDLLVLGVEEDIKSRIFPDWSMKTVNLDAASHIRLLPLKTLMQAVFDQQQIIDKMIWTIERTLKHEFQ